MNVFQGSTRICRTGERLPPDLSPDSPSPGEASLRHVLSNYAHHFHNERNHQGKANAILFPAPADRIGESSGEIRTRERLGGLLKFYHREAA